ncbi:MAG: PAS domain S-box protein [Inquilinus sp.]|nr:PAS domain S-box protein [Inquilinus sp.]
MPQVRNSRARIDFIVAAVVTVVLYVVAAAFDMTERFLVWALNYEQFELDEVPFAFGLGALAFGWYSFRRWREYTEAERRTVETRHKLTREIDGRTAAETALTESEERYRRLVELSPEGIMVHVDGRIAFVNPAANRMLGAATPEALIGREIAPLVHPDDRAAARAQVRRVLNEGRADLRAEQVLIALDGREFTVETSWTPILHAGRPAVLKVFRDISARKQAEAALMQQKSLLESIIRSVPDAVLVAGMDGRITLSNGGVTAIFGYRPDEIIGQPTGLLTVGPGRINGNRKDGEPALAEPLSAEGAYRRKNGDVFPAETVRSPIRDAKGRPLGAITVIRDISERKRADQEKASLQEQMHQSQKLESLGTLAGGIAHDFNNLLAIINGYGELVINDLEAQHPVRKNVAEILAAGRRAEELVAQILAYSRNDRRELKPLQLDALLTEDLGMLRATLPATLEVKSDIAKNVPPVMADATQMHQVIMNLCVNAGHATGKSPGHLNLRLRARTLGGGRDKQLRPLLAEWPASLRRIDSIANGRGGRMWIGRLHAGRYGVITVQDTGSGMDFSTLQRVFDPFFTTKVVGDGTGLGLASVEGIVRGHDGAIVVETELGQGTRFDVFLPTEAPAPTLATTEDEQSYQGDERILLVDDDESLVQAISLGLGKFGYDVTAMTDGTEAMEAFRDTPNRWDLVVADHMMPGLTGVELAEQALGIRPDLPIILCTGLMDSATRDSALTVGVREFHLKPVLASDLAASVRRIFNAESVPAKGVA